MRPFLIDNAVDAVSGAYIETQNDFCVEGTLPVCAARYYSSRMGLDNMPLGRNRMSLFDVTIAVKGRSRFEYTDEQGDRIGFESPGNNAASYNPAFPHLIFFSPMHNRMRIRSGRVEHYFQRYADGIYRLIQSSDLNENHFTLIRSDRGLLLSLVHTDGYKFIFGNNAAGQRTSVTWKSKGEAVVIAEYSYDAHGNMITADCAASRFTRYSYDEKQRLKSWQNLSGGSGGNLSYDRESRVIRIGRVGAQDDNIFEYNRRGRETVCRSGRGGELCRRFGYDENLNVIKEEDSLGDVKQYEYDDHGFRTAFINENGDREIWRYDKRGNIASYTEAEGRSAYYTWNDFGSLNVAIDGECKSWRYAYDLAGNIVKICDPAGNITRFERTECGQIAATHFADGTVERCSYDEYKRLTAITHANGGITRFKRGDWGEIIEQIDPSGCSTYFSYNMKSCQGFYEPAVIEQAKGFCIKRSFDEDGRIVYLREGEAREWNYSYNSFDLPSSVQNSRGGRFTLEYDDLGCLISVIDPLGRRWSFLRDAVGRVIKETDFSGQIFIYTYDKAGRIIKLSYEDGSYIDLSYDRSGLLTCETSFNSDGNIEDRSCFSYDRRGLLRCAENNAAVVSFKRDNLGRIIEENCNGRAIVYELDAMGRCLSRRIGSNSVKNCYDNLGFVRKVTIGDHPPVTFTRDIMGREIRRESAAGFVLEQAYDSCGRLKNQKAGFSIHSLGTGIDAAIIAQRLGINPIKATAKAVRDYCWNKNSELISEFDGNWGKTAYSYGCDGYISRAEFSDGAAECFHYDAAGNISGFSGADDQIHAWQQYLDGNVREAHGLNGESVSLEYDSRGRVARRTVLGNNFCSRTWRYSWNAKSQLVAVRLDNGDEYCYSYDPLGRRIFKIHKQAACAVQYEKGIIHIKEDAQKGAYYENDRGTYRSINGKIVVGSAYLWDGNLIAEEASLLSDGMAVWDASVRLYYGCENFYLLAGQRDAEKLLYIVTDGFGRPREIFTENGDLNWGVQFRVWGGLKSIREFERNEETHSEWTIRMTGDEIKKFTLCNCSVRFQGQWGDSESGLYYDCCRYYDPLTGQYLLPVPIGMRYDSGTVDYIASSGASAYLKQFLEKNGCAFNYLLQSGGQFTKKQDLPYVYKYAVSAYSSQMSYSQSASVVSPIFSQKRGKL